MEQLLVSVMMIWILSVMFQSDSFSAAVTNLSPSHTQPQMSTTSPGSDIHQSTGTRDGDISLKRSYFDQFAQPMEVTTNCIVQDRFAKCSRLHLPSVPQNLPADIILLGLEANDLKLLPNLTFARYNSLEYLNLSYNEISVLQADTFYNLSKLKDLRLFRNDLEFESPIFPIDVFCPLQSLAYLDIYGNNDNFEFNYSHYPDEALSCLRNLESLTIDGLPMNNQSSTFGVGFKNLTKLTTLKIDGTLDIYPNQYHFGGLYSHSFENLETLESLTIKACDIKGFLISGKPFYNLRKLRYLDISHNSDIGIEHLQPIFDGLYHLENLTELNMGSIVNPYSLGHCLDVSVFNKFPPHLTTLIASDNHLEAVDEQVMGMLPVNLTTLDLSGNWFTVGAYLRHLSKLKHLTTLYLNGYKSRRGFPFQYPHAEGPRRPTSHNCTPFTNGIYPFTLDLPYTLSHVEIKFAELNFDWSGLVVSSSVTHLNATGNNFNFLGGPITYLLSLKSLDLSLCAVEYIGYDFFSFIKSLEVLMLGSNALGEFLSDLDSPKVFQFLSKLKTLNLANNAITVLRGDLFEELTSLTSLYLEKNSFVSFDVDLKAIVALSVLNLAHTHVATLSEQTQAYFDNLSKNSGVNVSINMEYTPISCKCSNLHFLQWMTTSQAFAKPLQHYYCDIGYLGETSISDNYEETITVLRKQCASNGLLLFLAISATLTLCSLIIGAVVYRFRWNIRYLYYAVYLRFKKNTSAPENEREYDAFICYASEDAEFAEHTLDEELSNRGLRIFLHGRDFRAGDYVSSNIVNAVCSSKKTVVLLTEALLDSYWCGYEIEMAKLEGINTGRPVLIFVFLEDIPKNTLSRDLLYNIKNNTYVEYTSSASDPDQMRVWWDKLANDIRD